ncbi:MAG: hypothetical protein SWO11_22030 [Thermodesulfobacteriota bacterium]|nr:hypothetical protein [Thermodesulfobacteriota bacterium]
MENKEPYEKTDLWNKVKRPPASVLKKIEGGRLNNFTDISPQWRLQVLTEQFGPCGIGWKYTMDDFWAVPVPTDQMIAFAKVTLYIKNDGMETWSDGIPGVGGSMLVAQEKKGLYASDEAYKMAVTDALSVSCKALGIGADIYLGLWDGSKYKTTQAEFVTKEQAKELETLVNKTKAGLTKYLKRIGLKSLSEIPADQFDRAKAALEKRVEDEREPGCDDDKEE